MLAVLGTVACPTSSSNPLVCKGPDYFALLPKHATRSISILARLRPPAPHKIMLRAHLLLAAPIVSSSSFYGLRGGRMMQAAVSGLWPTGRTRHAAGAAHATPLLLQRAAPRKRAVAPHSQ